VRRREIPCRASCEDKPYLVLAVFNSRKPTYSILRPRSCYRIAGSGAFVYNLVLPQLFLQVTLAGKRSFSIHDLNVLIASTTKRHFWIVSMKKIQSPCLFRGSPDILSQCRTNPTRHLAACALFLTLFQSPARLAWQRRPSPWSTKLARSCPAGPTVPPFLRTAGAINESSISALSLTAALPR